MIHKKCNERMVLAAFDETICQECSTAILTGHTPGNIVCPECSKEKNLCEACGDESD